jgi:hypothetical protein
MSNFHSLINLLPFDIQLQIDAYYSEIKEYYTLKVLPLLSIKTRIMFYHDYENFLYITINNNRHHYLINPAKIMENHCDHDHDHSLLEYEMPENVINECNIVVKKNVWIKIHITEMFNYFGGSNNSTIEVLYINKYNYNQFAIKVINSQYGNKTFVVEPITTINLKNHCNYYSSPHFMHLPEITHQPFSIVAYR